MGRSQQRKGADGERELARILTRYGYDLQRGGSLSFGEAPDLVGLPSRSPWLVTMKLYAPTTGEV